MGLCLLVCLACGEEKKEESKPKTVPTVRPPPVESLAALAPADTVGYVEIGPLGTLEDLIDPELLWVPSPFLRAARNAADPARPVALAFQRKGWPITLLWLGKGARLQREQAEDELLDIREFGRRALIHHIDEQYVAPASPIALTQKLPAGAVRGRFQIDAMRKLVEDRLGPMAAGLLRSLDPVESVALGLGLREGRIFLRGESVLRRPVALAPSSLPALLSALPEDMPLVVGVDVEIGKLAHLLVPFASGPIAAQLEAASILGRGYLFAARPSMQGTEFIQLFGEADMGAYFARLRALIDKHVAGDGIRIREPSEGVIEISADAEQLADELPSLRHLAFAGAKDPARMARVLADRLVRNDFAHLETRVEGEFVVTARPLKAKDVARFKELVCRPFGFELHHTVEPGAPTYAHYRKLFARSRSEHVPPRDRADEDKAAKRYAQGLRWYPAAVGGADLGDRSFNGWILCALDDAQVTGGDLVDAWHASPPDSLDKFWVKLEFKRDSMARITRLTGKPGHLAIIVNRAVLQAPGLARSLPRETRLPGRYTREEAIRIAGEIRSRGSTLRFAREVPSPLFREANPLGAAAQPFLPDGRMRIRVAQAGRRGVLAVNSSDERVDEIVAKLQRSESRGDVRFELRADLEHVLVFLDEFRTELGVVGRSDYPRAMPAQATPTLTVRISGGDTSLRLDATVDDGFVRRIRIHARQRELMDQLDRLVETSSVERANLEPDPWGRPLRLEEFDDGRTLIRSDGPDKEPGTEDDITRAVGSPRLDGRVWFEKFVALIRAGKLDAAWAMHKGHEVEALSGARRYAQQGIYDAESYRELRRLVDREPHMMMADREFWNVLRRRDARWLKDGTLKLEFVGEERVDDRQHIRIRYTRGDWTAETVAVLVHEEGAVRIQTPPDWLAKE